MATPILLPFLKPLPAPFATTLADAQPSEPTFKFVEVLKTRRKHDHRHPQVEILLVKSGSGTWIIGESLGEFREGDLFILGSGTAHSFFQSPGAKGEIRALVMQFQPVAIRKALSSFPEFHGFEAFLTDARRGLLAGSATRAAVLPLVRRIGELPPASPRRLGVFLSVLAELASADDLISIGGPQVSVGPGGGLDEKLDRVCKLIQSSLVNPLSQAAVAGRIGMSPAAFSRWFKHRIGKPYTEYINEARIDLVCRALIESDRDIAHVAGECGFAAGSHFHKLFKACKGVSPTEYRRLSRAE
ncbi:MAG: helix-turn-helix domain-containing protein [Fibrobacteres bacterium]|nr:helix-turn-helix domain-containing protein [Fibrobacterota bacterium]